MALEVEPIRSNVDSNGRIMTTFSTNIIWIMVIGHNNVFSVTGLLTNSMTTQTATQNIDLERATWTKDLHPVKMKSWSM